MSRSGYSEDCETIQLYRANVERSIQGKRGQALLRELKDALLALPEKKLCSEFFANTQTGEVCALGAVALHRKIKSGMSVVEAIKEIDAKYPEGEDARSAAKEFNIAECLAAEITFVNDEMWNYKDDESRYDGVLKWVLDNLKD